MSSVLPDPNRFDLARIAASSLIKSLEYRPSLGSTQDLAAELAGREQLATPALVLAGQQTAGRGRGRSSWWAAPGALTFSLVLDDLAAWGEIHPDPRHSLAAGLALCEVIRQLAPKIDCGLKWPNDVYLGARKVCGILVETISGSGGALGRTILGIGVNVNNPLCEAAPDIAASAVSLFDATGRHHDLSDLLLAVLARLQDERAALSRQDPDQVERWQACSLLNGRSVVVESGSRLVAGRCLGIAPSGALRLATDVGEQQVFAGTVRQVDPPYFPS